MGMKNEDFIKKIEKKINLKFIIDFCISDPEF